MFSHFTLCGILTYLKTTDVAGSLADPDPEYHEIQLHFNINLVESGEETRTVTQWHKNPTANYRFGGLISEWHKHSNA